MGIEINLTPELEEMVRQKVASGLYTTASEVICEALRLMDEKSQLLNESKRRPSNVCTV